MARNTTKIVIADDHDLMVAALSRVLSDRDDVEIVGRAKRGDDVLPLVLETQPDVVLLDVGMPGTDGIECARRLRERLPELRIMMLTAYGDADTLQAAERAGADAFILKTVGASDFFEAMNARAPGMFQVAGFPEPGRGEAKLTARERVVMQAVGDGLKNREIARELWITEETVKFHLKNVYRKLGVSSRDELRRQARDGAPEWSSPRPTRLVG
jgi:two-component system, NarL family, nitrate/nitrite response regulator NarL